MATDTTDTTASPADMDGHGASHGHGEIHLPPNSWSPIVLTLGLTIFFVGLLVGPAMWIIGALLTAGTLVAWFRAARSEFAELPDEL